ncbi:MAG: DUF4838 domain-containing protein [Planctomycetes bacterium]|nr:DUF4838 domain-containing protein [Planctomycetota bacterium]
MHISNTGTPKAALGGWAIASTGILLLLAAVEVKAAPPASPAVAITKDGLPLLPIIAGSVKEPVEELKRYLKEISGAEFRVEKPAKESGGIYVGLAADFPSLKIEEPAKLAAEGFVLKTDGANIYLIGHEALGVRHAVTTFLHRLGCRWFFPGQVWEVIPRQKTIEIACDVRQAPSFAIDRRIWYGFGAYAPCAKDLTEWNRHNRMGGPVDIKLGHTWFGIDAKKDFVDHPEWFALVDGQRKASKPCYSHPDVIKRAIKYALDQASGGASMISMSPPDGLGYCECERCMAVCRGGGPYKKHSTTFAKRPDGVLINVTSETLFSCVNQVAAAVAEKHPKTLIGCMAYSAYSHPPSFRMHPNVFLQVTTGFRRTDLTLEEQLTAFKKQECRAGIYDYFSVYQWDWDASSGKKKLAPDKLQESLRFYHKNGVSSINAESSNNWAPRGLSYYLAAQLMWDVNADVKALLRDFYEKAFGPAAGAMERYYVHWYGGAAAGMGEVVDETGDAKEPPLDQEKLTVLFKDLDDACQKAKDRPDCIARIDHLRIYLHYLTLRLRTQQVGQGKDEKAILEAIRAETEFGGRLTYTNMLHSRALLGGGFLRRFKPFEKILDNVPEAKAADKGWRKIGTPPTHDEIEKLWAEDKAALGVK